MEVRYETERPLLTKRNENFCKCICISINNIDQKFSFTFGSHYKIDCISCRLYDLNYQALTVGSHFSLDCAMRLAGCYTI